LNINRKKFIITLTLIFAIAMSAIASITLYQTAYAKPDSKKPIKDGTIMAGAYVYCTNSDSIVKRSFNNMNDQEITISDGDSLGVCTIDFGFDVSNRYIVATVTHPTTPLGVTVSAPPFSGNTVSLFVWHAGNIAPVAGGDIFIIVY